MSAQVARLEPLTPTLHLIIAISVLLANTPPPFQVLAVMLALLESTVQPLAVQTCLVNFACLENSRRTQEQEVALAPAWERIHLW